MRTDDLFHYKDIDLKTTEYDGTYGACEGSVVVRICRECGALVHDLLLDAHAAQHPRPLDPPTCFDTPPVIGTRQILPAPVPGATS